MTRSYNKPMAKEEAAPKPASFETGLDELERVVKQLEGSELPLEKSLELFEKGMQLAESCRKQLVEAENRVEILVKKSGQVQAEPFGSDPA